MASSVGAGILNLLGYKDPRQQLLQGGGLGGGGGAHTPGGVAPAPGAPTPAAPAQPMAYTSPPELLSMYNELLGRQERENRINTGLGLIGTSFAQPDNRESIMSAMTGGGSGTPSETLDLIMSLQEMQKADEAAAIAAQDKDRQIGMLPGLAREYGMSPETVRLLYDNGQLDEFVSEAGKPDVEIREDADGGIVSINKKDGTVKVLSNGYGPNADIQTYEVDMRDREARGEPRISVQQWNSEQANLKKPVTNVNIDTKGMSQADMKLVEALDAGTVGAFTAAQDGVKTIETVQSARRQMDMGGGVIVGDMTAPARLEGMKMFAAAFPGMDSNAITNTETFSSQMKSIVLPLVKQLGTGNSISNADREYVEKMVGSAQMSEGALRRILDITERGQRREIAKANARMEARVGAAGPDSPLAKVFQPVAVPDLSAEYIESTLAPVDKGDLTLLINNQESMSYRSEFDKAYGDGASRDIIEAATGIDPGPLTAKRISSSKPDK